MSIEIIRYELKDHTADELIAAYREAATHLEAAPECLSFELSQCEEEPISLILRIHWQSTEAHMSGFRKRANFAPFFNAIRPFLSEIAEMRHYQPTELVWARGTAE